MSEQASKPQPEKEPDQYGPRFLYAEDLILGGKYCTSRLTIEQVFNENTVESLQTAGKQLKDDQRKFINQRIIRFKGKSKLWGINFNVERVIQSVTGEPFGDEWIGKEIRIGVRVVKLKGALTPAIRALPEKDTLIRLSVRMSLGIVANYGEELQETEKRYNAFLKRGGKP